MDKALYDTSVEELRDLTRLTYAPEKKDLIEKYSTVLYKEKPIQEYIERLEYECKVIDAM